MATEGADAAVRMGGHLGKNVSQSGGRCFKSLRIMLQSTSSNSWAVLVNGYSAAGIINKLCMTLHVHVYLLLNKKETRVRAKLLKNLVFSSFFIFGIDCWFFFIFHMMKFYLG